MLALDGVGCLGGPEVSQPAKQSVLMRGGAEVEPTSVSGCQVDAELVELIDL